MKKNNKRGDELLGLYDMAFKLEAEKGTGEAVRTLKNSLKELIGKDRGVLLVYKEACRIISPQDGIAIVFSGIAVILSFLAILGDALLGDLGGVILFSIYMAVCVVCIVGMLIALLRHPGHPFEYGVILRLLEEIEKEDF